MVGCQTVNVSSVKFNELSDEGLDLVGQVLKAIKASQQPVIDVPALNEGRRRAADGSNP